MSSGFNHVKITIGSELNNNEPVDVTEQVDADIFTNDKLVYCDVSFSDISISGALGFNNLVTVMSRLSDRACMASLIVPFGDSGAIIGIALSRLDDNRVYFSLSFQQADAYS